MRRTARPEPSVPITSLESRLAGGPTPQYNQTGIGSGSSNSLLVQDITATGTVKGAVGTFTSLTIGSSAPKSMAFQSATGVQATLANSSWLNGPITSTAATFSGTLTLGTFTTSTGLVTGYFSALTSTGGVVKLAVMST